MIIIINDNLTTGKICVRTEEDLVWTAFCRGMEVCQFIHQRHYQSQLIHAVRDRGCEEVMIVHASRKGIWWWIVFASCSTWCCFVCLTSQSLFFYSLVFFFFFLKVVYFCIIKTGPTKVKSFGCERFIHLLHALE